MAAHKDPRTRLLTVIAVLFLLVAVSGATALLAKPKPQDLRWADYQSPTLVGLLDEDGAVTRDVTDDGVPIVDGDLVHVVFQRCGPVAEVPVVSTRTWVLTAPDSGFVGIPGGAVTATIGNDAGDCVVFELDYQIPMGVVDRIKDLRCDCPIPIELRFLLVPLDNTLGPLDVTTEQFYRQQDVGDEPVSTETIDTKD